MDDKKLTELREYYDTHDTSEEMEGGEWVTEVDDDPEVTTSRSGAHEGHRRGTGGSAGPVSQSCPTAGTSTATQVNGLFAR